MRGRHAHRPSSARLPPSPPRARPSQSLRNFSALTKGETFRILYNKKKYDIGVVEVRQVGGAFEPGAAEAVCIIEADVQVDFEAPADYVEPKRPSPKASPVSASPLQKSPLMESLGAPKLDEDSSDEEEGAKTFEGAGFRLDGKAIKAPKVGASPQGGNLLGGDVKIGVRIGGDGQLLSSAAPAAAPAPAAADGDDYWAKFSSQGQKLR